MQALRCLRRRRPLLLGAAAAALVVLGPELEQALTWLPQMLGQPRTLPRLLPYLALPPAALVQAHQPQLHHLQPCLQRRQRSLSRCVAWQR